MNYPQVSIKDAATELNRLDAAIQSGMRQTVADAIRAGEILSQVKDRLGHGEFLPWIEENCGFSRQTADNYRRLYEHRDKLPTVSNLQEAYKKIEQIETADKQTENQRARGRVSEFRETGVKPKGWRRGTDDNLVKEDKGREERIAAARVSAAEGQARRKNELKSKEADRAERRETDELLSQAAARAVESGGKRQEFKEKIKVSQDGQRDQFLDALMDYLNELESDSRRIEACQNIIKVCRNVAAELQL